METISILFSIPAAFIAIGLYCLFLQKFVRPSERRERWVRGASYPVLVLFAVEILVLTTIGAVRSRGILGPSLNVVQLICFVFGVPSLVNVIVLRQGSNSGLRWYVAWALGTVLAIVLVFLQYGIDETVYGIDGQGGPYGQSADH